MDYDKLCKDILKFDSNVRFAGVCDETGEIRFGGQRQGVNNLLTPEETKKSNLQAFARWRLRIYLLLKSVRENMQWQSMKRLNVYQFHQMLTILSW